MRNILAALLLATAAAPAAIVVVAPTATTPGSLTITHDITFQITASGTPTIFVLSNFVPSDGSQTGSVPTPSLVYEINGSSGSASLVEFRDNLAVTSDPMMSQNDAFFFAIIGNAVSPGDTFTLKAQEYTLAPEDGFNPLASQTFTGEMYIMELGGNRLSNTVTVPEPSTTFLLAALSIPLLRRKRH